jgi:hypothetical protein
MITEKQITQNSNRLAAGSHDSQGPTLDTDKAEWLEKYASRILAVWSHWQTPLGVACAYTDKIKTDLVRFYDDPLKRMFIEATY